MDPTIVRVYERGPWIRGREERGRQSREISDKRRGSFDLGPSNGDESVQAREQHLENGWARE